MKKILAVIGTRPQFIKHCPVAIAAKGVFNLVTVDTGQHYDYNMREVFLEELSIQPPDYSLRIEANGADNKSHINLNAGNKSHMGLSGEIGELYQLQIPQVQEMVDALIPVIQKEKPSGIIVYGDTNSTIAGALAATASGVALFHVEAGLRSYNPSMPEEQNRVLTDRLSALLFAPSVTAVDNLRAEGFQENVFMVGDVMLDMLELARQSRKTFTTNNFREPLQSGNTFKAVAAEPFIYATIHRPYNTNDPERLTRILETFQSLPLKVRFSVHPRIQHVIHELPEFDYTNIEFIAPLSYYESIDHILQCQAVITDSGGLQKEAYYLQKKCITIRPETEWTETLSGNWNTLVFEDLHSLREILSHPCGDYVPGLYGSGHAAPKIIEVIGKKNL